MYVTKEKTDVFQHSVTATWRIRTDKIQLSLAVKKMLR